MQSIGAVNTGCSAGGSAAGGSINFQAAVTAIVQVHIAMGSKLGWLESLVSDVPIGVSVETGGAGDDLGVAISH